MSETTAANNPDAPRTGWKPVLRAALLKRWCGIAIAPLLLGTAIARAFHDAVACRPYPLGIYRPPDSCTWIEDRNGVPLAAFASTNGDWHLPLAESDISPHLIKAIVAVEDARFYQHAGVDW